MALGLREMWRCPGCARTTSQPLYTPRELHNTPGTGTFTQAYPYKGKLYCREHYPKKGRQPVQEGLKFVVRVEFHVGHFIDDQWVKVGETGRVTFISKIGFRVEMDKERPAIEEGYLPWVGFSMPADGLLPPRFEALPDVEFLNI